MAKLFAEVVIAGNYRKLAQATKGANKQMSGMGKASQKMSGIMKSAIAGIGFAQITSQLINAAKAADEDRRSMALLNKTLDNSWKANDKTKKSVDEFITSMSTMSGIADDDLRPSYAKIANQTKSLTKANKMFALAMDISADKGVSLDVAAKAVSKAMAGNENAFNRLYPAAKDSGDAIDYVTEKSKGAAKVAGDNSPFARMNIQFEEMQETIGRELLPYVDKLADWMASKEGQKTIKETTKAVVDLLKEAGKIAKWAIENKEIVLTLVTALAGLQIGSSILTSWKTLSTIWKGIKAPKLPVGGVGAAPGVGAGGAAPVAGAAAKGGAAKTGASLAALSAPVATAAAATAAVAVYGASMVDLYNKDKKKYADEVKSQVDRARASSSNGYFSATDLLLATDSKKNQPYNPGGAGGNMFNPATAKPQTVNITVNAPNITGPAVLDALKKTARRKGVPLKLLID